MKLSGGLERDVGHGRKPAVLCRTARRCVPRVVGRAQCASAASRGANPSRERATPPRARSSRCGRDEPAARVATCKALLAVAPTPPDTLLCDVCMFGKADVPVALVTLPLTGLEGGEAAGRGSAGRILQANSVAHARFTQQAKRGRRLLIEAVVRKEFNGG